jgi:hypothetical protein
MKVRATAKGYFGGKLREPGETFTLSEEAQFSKEWMERAADAPAEPEGRKPRGAAKQD